MIMEKILKKKARRNKLKFLMFKKQSYQMTLIPPILLYLVKTSLVLSNLKSKKFIRLKPTPKKKTKTS